VQHVLTIEPGSVAVDAVVTWQLSTTVSGRVADQPFSFTFESPPVQWVDGRANLDVMLPYGQDRSGVLMSFQDPGFGGFLPMNLVASQAATPLGAFTIGAAVEVEPSVSVGVAGLRMEDVRAIAYSTGGDIDDGTWVYDQLVPVPSASLDVAPVWAVDTVHEVGARIGVDFQMSMVAHGFTIPFEGRLFSRHIELMPGGRKELAVVPEPVLAVGLPLLSLDLDEAGMDFGRVPVQGSERRRIWVTNDGDAPLEVSVSIPEHAFYAPLQDVLVIEPGEQQPILVQFVPELEGDFDGVVTLRTNDPTQLVIEVPVAGSAGPEPPADPDPDRFLNGGGETVEGASCGCEDARGVPGLAVLLPGLVLLRRRR